MIAELDIRLGTESMGRFGTLSDRGLIDCLNNAADAHAAQLGQSAFSAGGTGVSWVLMAWTAEALRRPRAGETLRARTWIRAATRAVCERDFELEDAAGRPVARATSRLMALDARSRQLTRLDEALIELYQPEYGRCALPGAEFLDAGRFEAAPEREVEAVALRAMTDINDHIHNSCYFDLIQEALPDELWGAEFRHIQMSYRRALQAGQRVRVQYCPLGNKHCVALRESQSGALSAVAALYGEQEPAP